jgi:hypothetical protein
MNHWDLDDEFENFMRRVFPTVKELDRQYLEARRIFASGAASMYFHLTGDVTAVPDDEGVKELARIDKELTDFFKRQIGFNR